jgi:hypothetical protein
VRLEDEPSEPVKALTRPLTSEAVRESEPVRDLARPLVSEPETESDPARDLARPFDSEAPIPTRSPNALPILLVRETVRESEPDIDLKNEDFFVPLVERPTEPEGLVEQERGLLLQISFPESTLTTMLPITIETEPASVLR